MASNSPDLVLVTSVQPALGEAGKLVDLVIENGTLKSMGPQAAKDFDGKPARRIDGKGRIVFPGFVDIHTHLREPGLEYKEDIQSGLEAAGAGGFATVCCMPNTNPVNDTRAITESMVARAKSLGGVALYPIGAITRGLEGKELTEMGDLRDAGAVGVSDDGVCVRSSGVMRRALEYARSVDMVIMQHAEDHDLTAGAQMHEGAQSTRLGLRGWPRVAEDIIVARDLLLAELTQARYHVAHMSSGRSVQLVRDAKDRGIEATAEVTPHHLLLTDAELTGYPTHCKVNPPLREYEDRDALWEGLADGTIDCIATDHAPHSTLEKDCTFAEASPGMVGLEICMASLFHEAARRGVSRERLVDALTTAPSKIIGIEAPCLEVGKAASFCLFDPEENWIVGRNTLRSKSWNTPFLGKSLSGRVVCTMAHGKLVFGPLS